MEPRLVLSAGLLISELMASNTSTLEDEDGDTSDWIEIFNNSPEPASLEGWFLTDSPSELDRWEFPDVTLEAGEYFVVFASGKDRRDPSGELHTDFSLDADGEYLALVEPNGQTIAHEYRPGIPPQRADISYGLEQQSQQVVAPGATWSYFVPSNGELGDAWRQSAFDDSSWSTGPSSFGFGVVGPGFHVRRVSADVDVFGPVDSLRRANLLLQRPDSSPEVATAADAVTRTINFFDSGDDGHFTGNLAFPGDTPGNDDHFAVRVTGTLVIPERAQYTFGTNSDDGVHVRIDGRAWIIDDALHGPEDRFTTIQLNSGLHPIEITYFEAAGGAELEFFATPGAYSTYRDAFALVGSDAEEALTAFTEEADSAETSVADALQGVDSSHFMRHEFSLGDLTDVVAMTLNVRYSDGFVAYLNGVEVARRGVTGDVAWNSSAEGDRPLQETLSVERISLGQFASLLQEGDNVLAIQALKSGPQDGTLLIEPSLELAASGELVSKYFLDPTPGHTNGQGALGWPDAPSFSVGHGFYDAPQTVTIQTDTPGATIRYTIDGSSPLTGTVYSGPITIDRTSTLRAVATLEGYLASDVTTQTYLFLNDVIRQTESSAFDQGFPPFGVNSQFLRYGMDQFVVDNVIGPEETVEALTAISSISLVTDLANLFDPSAGIYVNARSRGRAWERPVSVEIINPDGSEGYQIDAGLRIRGGFSRSGGNPKHAFRLFFRGEYGGPSEFAWFGEEGADEFRNIDLRTSQNYSWSFQGSDENTFEREVFSRDTQRDMGYEYTRSRYYHLYINGHYWGIFQTQERSESDFAATYFGGEASEYDVVKSAGDSGGYTIEATDGNMDAWAQLWDLAVSLAQSPTAEADNYWTMQGLNPDGTRNPDLPVLLDVNALIDYMLIIFYTGNRDAPLSGFLGNDRPNNWFSIYNRERADRGFQFFQHDGEHSLGVSSSEHDRTGPFLSGNRFSLSYSNPQFLHQHLMAHPEYRLRFADRTHLHLENGGALTYEKSLARFNARVDEVSAAVPAEQARWGGFNLGVPQYLAQIDEVREYFVTRSGIVLNQLRADGLYPALGGPRFNQHGGLIGENFRLIMESPTGQGTLYYTLNGSDPRLFDGSLNPAAQVFDGQTVLRTLVPQGSTWNYHDTGQNLGTAWREPGYNDAAWDSGPAQLGYGDGDEVTQIGFGGDSGNKHITTYFRRTFNVDTTDPFSHVTLRLLRDDGAVVYVNGQEVVRTNLPSTSVTAGTLSSTAVGGEDESTFLEFEIPPNVLVPGENTIAVELHQVSPTSSDISFDLELFGSSVSGGIPLTETSQVRARILDGSTWSALSSADFTASSVPAGMDNLRISEINYNPYDALPQFGDSNVDNDLFEFLELVNTSQTETLQLDGVRFTAGIEFNFTNSSVTSLAPGERVLVVKDIAAFGSRYGSGHNIAGAFGGDTNLSNQGELIEVVDGTGGIIQRFTYEDSGDWPERADGGGSSLVPEDLAGDYNVPANWDNSSLYGGSPGAGDAALVDVIVNEVLAHTDPPLMDSIELYNTTTSPVDISGWWLSDEGDALTKFRVPDGTILPAGGYLVFTAGDFNPGGGTSETDFSLSAAGEDVYLMASAPSGRPHRFADHVEFDAQLTGVSLGRLPSDDAEADLFPLASPSLGSANGAHRPGEVVFSEVNYHAADPPAGNPLTEHELQYAELYNRSGIPVDLSGWRVDRGIDFEFPQGTMLAAGGTLVVVAFDPATGPTAGQFRSVYGIGAGVVLVGPFLGNLANGGEEVRLLAPTDPPAGEPLPVHYLVDRVTFSDDPPWPDEADGDGSSLHRLSAETYGDLAASWEADDPTPGSVDFSQPPVLAGDYNGNGLVEQADLDLVLSQWGQSATPPPANWIHDLPTGFIDQDELDGVLSNWGASTAAAVRPVATATRLVRAVPQPLVAAEPTTTTDPFETEPAAPLAGAGLALDAAPPLKPGQASRAADHKRPAESRPTAERIAQAREAAIRHLAAASPTSERAEATDSRLVRVRSRTEPPSPAHLAASLADAALAELGREV